MTDEQRRRKVERAIEGFLRYLGVWQTYRISIGFTDKISGGWADDSSATVSSSPPYRNIDIQYDRDYVDAATPEEIEGVTGHEVIHAVGFAEAEDVFLNLLTLAIKEKVVAKGQDQIDWLNKFRYVQENAVDLLSLYLERRRPKYGYHYSGVPNTRASAKQPRRQSVQ